MSFIERIKEIIEEDFESQNDFARNLGVSGVTISTYTSGKQRPKYDVLEKIYNKGYSIDWLISGKGKMKKQEPYFSEVSHLFEFMDGSNAVSTVPELEKAKIIVQSERINQGKDYEIYKIYHFENGGITGVTEL